jgi:hypothetical protein
MSESLVKPLSRALALLVCACGANALEPTDAGFSDAGVEAGPVTPAPLEPYECEEFTSLYGYAETPREASGVRSVVEVSLFFPGEALSFFFVRDEVANGGRYGVGADDDDAIFALLGTDCASRAFEDCETVWAPTTGFAFVERIGAPGAELRVVMANVLWAPVRLDGLEVRFTGERRCRFYERVDLGGVVTADSCTAEPPSRRCDLAAGP